MSYTIGEIARRFDLSPSTLRYYDKEGLLPFVERTANGTRLFEEKDLEWLHIIECLKKTGMSIKNIKTFIDWCIEGDSTIEQRLSLIEAQHQAVAEQIAQLQETLSVLDYKKWYYETALAAGTCRIHDTLSADAVPEPYREAVSKLRGMPHED